MYRLCNSLFNRLLWNVAYKTIFQINSKLNFELKRTEFILQWSIHSHIRIRRYVCPIHVTAPRRFPFCMTSAKTFPCISCSHRLGAPHTKFTFTVLVDGFKIATGNKDKWQHLTLIQKTFSQHNDFYDHIIYPCARSGVVVWTICLELLCKLFAQRLQTVSALKQQLFSFIKTADLFSVTVYKYIFPAFE